MIGRQRDQPPEAVNHFGCDALRLAVPASPVDQAMPDGVGSGKVVRIERGEGRPDRGPAVRNVDGTLDGGVGTLPHGEPSAGVADPLDRTGRERHLALPELVESELERRRAGVEAEDAKGRHAHTSDHVQSRTSGMSSRCSRT